MRLKNERETLRPFTVRLQPLQFQRVKELAEDWGWSQAKTCRDMIDRGLNSLENRWELAIHELEDLYLRLEDEQKQNTVARAQEILFQEKVEQE